MTKNLVPTNSVNRIQRDQVPVYESTSTQSSDDLQWLDKYGGYHD